MTSAPASAAVARKQVAVLVSQRTVRRRMLRVPGGTPMVMISRTFMTVPNGGGCVNRESVARNRHVLA